MLTVLHRNFIGVDEFLGRINIPLSEFDIYERPRNRWYTLQSKAGKENKKERGELEVKIAFIVKAGSLTDLSKKEKHKSSIGQLSQAAQSIGGSLLSLGTLEKRKGLKKFAKSIGSKMNLKHKKKDKEYDGESIGSVNSLRRRKGIYDNNLKSSKQTAGDADPGVVSDDDEFTFDDLSHNSSISDLSHHNPIENKDNPPVGSLENLAGGEVLRRHTVAVPTKKPDAKPVDEWEEKLYGKSGKQYHSNEANLNKISWEPTKIAVQIDEELPEPQIPVKKETVVNSPKQTKISKEEKKEQEKERKREEKEKKAKAKSG